MLLLLAQIAMATVRADRPWSFSGIIGLPGGFGVDLGWQPSDRLGLDLQLSSWLAISDLGLQARGFVLADDRRALTVVGGVHALFAPILFEPGALDLELGLGGEYRAPTGFTIGGELGPALWLSDPHHTEGGGGISPAAFGRLRVGYSW